jgi:hypothetical protein
LLPVCPEEELVVVVVQLVHLARHKGPHVARVLPPRCSTFPAISNKKNSGEGVNPLKIPLCISKFLIENSWDIILLRIFTMKMLTAKYYAGRKGAQTKKPHFNF